MFHQGSVFRTAELKTNLGNGMVMHHHELKCCVKRLVFVRWAFEKTAQVIIQTAEEQLITLPTLALVNWY